MITNRVKLWTTRIVVIERAPGTYSDGSEWVTLDEAVDVDAIQTYRWRYTALEENNHGEPLHPLWLTTKVLWDTARPVGAPSPQEAQEAAAKGPPEPAVVKLPWWRRWFFRRVPPARVVKR